MDRLEILGWLRERDEGRLEELWRLADRVRRENVGDAVHLRGLIEISNHCVRACGYCGLRADRRNLERYRMTDEEILESARRAASLGYGTVVMQSGEDPGISRSRLAEVVVRIKAETPLAVTLSVGERSEDDLAGWRRAGADRYLLRFETSNRELYDRIHPPLGGRRSDRQAGLRTLRKLGYEVGSGVMIGIPGQTYENLAADIEMFRELDLDMIGVGPFIAHGDTPIGGSELQLRAPEGVQAPNTELMTCKVVALTRIVCPLTNLPSTTALATLDRSGGRELGLLRGANVIMPNVTPMKYRRLYDIYPDKACLYESPDEFHRRLRERILSVGRTVGIGRGDSLNYTSRTN